MSDTTIYVVQPAATLVDVTGPTTTVRTNVPTVPNPRYWGALISTASQTNPVGSAINLMEYSSLQEGEGVTLTQSNRINVTNAGTYRLGLVVNVTKSDAGQDDVYFWLRKNATNEANSTMRHRLDGNNAHDLVILEWVITLAALDYVQVAWSSSDTDLSLSYQGTQTTPTRPATPSVHAHIFQIGD